MSKVLVYGAYGYTGALIARLARERGLEPVLAGRDAARVTELASELSLPARAFALDDPAAIDRGLEGVTAVLHAAGPFHRTWRPMAEACLRAGAHYLDITGEAEVFLALQARSEEAKSHGVMLLPGVGFDVVPSDGLAAHLARRLPGATHLMLAFRSDSGPSRGTALTMVDHLHEGGLVRRAGELRRVPPAWRTRLVDFGRGPETAVSIPWGDVVTAWEGTRIPNITVYMAMPPRAAARLKWLRWLGPALAWGPVKGWLRRRVEARPAGPSAERLRQGETLLWGEVRDAEGRRAEARMRGPQAYRWTAITAVAALEKVLAGAAEAGYQTPSTAFGPDFVLAAGGAEREDVRGPDD